MEAPPFRVLSPAGRLLYEPVPKALPPPARAPEPYKITPLSQSYGRSHRTSSFAIIAEPRPASPAQQQQQQLAPEPASSAPPGAPSRPGSGRVSPFRGRGFKGPPPRARSRSRPRSPDSRRGSLSNQNSPKRSQIPRFAAARAAAKENGFARKASPKFGRRAAGNNNSNNNNNNNNNNNSSSNYTSSIVANKNNANNSNNNNRRQPVQRASELSPIQGSPAKHSANNNKNAKATTIRANGAIPRAGATSNNRFDRNHLAPPRAQPGGKRFITASSSTPTAQQRSNNTNNTNNNNTNNNNNNNSTKASKGSLNSSSAINDSPSKIPRRQASSDSNPNLSKIEQPAKQQLTANSNAHDAGALPRNASLENLRADKKKRSSSKDSPQTPTTAAAAAAAAAEEELGLVDLLKQSSGATGTSSVVNTTTTTAVQPLHIDAASILSEGELVAKLASLEKKQKSQEADAKSASNNSGLLEGKAAGGNGGKGKNGNLTQTMIKHFGNEDGKEAPASESKQDVIMEENESQGNASLASHNKSDSKSSIAQSSNKSTTSTTNDSKNRSPNADNSKIVNESGEDASKSKNSLARTKTGQEAIATESDSMGSLHSSDTGVSVNTVKGVSSAKEKTGLHVVKRTDEIETLSGNIVHLDNNGERQTAAAATTPSAAGGGRAKPARPAKARKKQTAAGRWKRLKLGNKFVSGGGGGGGAGPKARKKKSKLAGCWPRMRCLALKREPKGQPWPGSKQARNQTASTLQLTLDSPDNGKTGGIQATPGRWARIKEACRCAKLRARTRLRGRVRRGAQAAQVAPAEMPPRRPGCCPGGAERRLGGLCRGLFSRCAGSCSGCWAKCCSCGCDCWPACCKKRDAADKPRNARAKQSVGSIVPPPVSEEVRPKLPDVLIEHNSVMRGAIPCLPVPLAWFCLICNVLLPGSGSVLSGLFNLCSGQPRFSATASPKARFGAFIVNIVVGVSQLFTVLFCLVGWGWSIWWGVTMLRVAKKYKRFKESEAGANDPEARGAEGGIALPAPGVAGQALRAGGADRPR